jgi:hypothetical protein
MATPAQLLANRLNSQKSTGPRSDEGKAASRMNALKHGARAESLIIPGEDPEALAELTAAYRDECRPEGPQEELLLETIVRADWTRRRMARLEAEVFTALLADSTDATPGAAFLADAQGANAFQKIYRREQAALREWRQARAELRRLQEERRFRESTERTQSRIAPPAHPAVSPAPECPPEPPARSENRPSSNPGARSMPVTEPYAFTGAEPASWRL